MTAVTGTRHPPHPFRTRAYNQSTAAHRVNHGLVMQPPPSQPTAALTTAWKGSGWLIERALVEKAVSVERAAVPWLSPSSTTEVLRATADRDSCIRLSESSESTDAHKLTVTNTLLQPRFSLRFFFFSLFHSLVIT